MFANCSMGGMQFAMPDVCLTPIPSPAGPIPTPIPYPNISMLPMAIPPTCSMKHFISMMPAHNMATTVPMTSGDSTGAMGGVMSGMMMGPARSMMGSVKVFTGGLPATKMLSPSMQNMTNAPGGMTLAPSQVKVLIIS